MHAKNFVDDPRVTSMHAAVVSSESEKTAIMQLAPKGETWRNSLQRYTYYKNKEELETVSVPCVTVNRLLAQNPDVHTVKIDIEGAEMEVLEAMEVRCPGLEPRRHILAYPSPLKRLPVCVLDHSGRATSRC
eukprot:SAG22_NODE_174_length_16466_cov_34.991568_4_plen_132_part_00